MSLRGIADETLAISDRGFYDVAGHRIDIAVAQRAAVAGTKLYRPEELRALATSAGPTVRFSEPLISVTAEKTQGAARRLALEDGVSDLLVLNFASARNVGGGFRRGAKAQEEDVARCSGLYRCLEQQPGYYEANRTQNSLLYTDHMIYAPRVPWFRVRNRELLETPFLASVVTAPAPNAGEHLRRVPDGGPQVRAALRRRAAYLLALAEAEQHTALLLGAWGCGVFRNDPREVASAFLDLLETQRFLGSFQRVVFAVFDSTKDQANLRAFRERLASRGLS